MQDWYIVVRGVLQDWYIAVTELIALAVEEDHQCVWSQLPSVGVVSPTLSGRGLTYHEHLDDALVLS